MDAGIERSAEPSCPLSVVRQVIRRGRRAVAFQKLLVACGLACQIERGWGSSGVADRSVHAPLLRGICRRRWRWCGGSGTAGGSWSGLHCGWRWSVRGGGQECPRSFAQGHMPAGVEVVERQAQREVSLLAGIRRPSLPGEEKEWRRGLRVAVVHVRISGTITPCPLTWNEAAGVPPTP
jgi:hypothetical protein